MVNLIASVLGVSLAVIFVGFFAIAVDRPPLSIIVLFGLGLMLVATYQDVRDSWKLR